MTPMVDAAYGRCRRIARAHGTTYFWAAALLPRDRRQHVWALYAFARVADDIVDDLGPVSIAERERALSEFGDRLFDDLRAGWSEHPVLAAVVRTARVLRLDQQCFQRFLHSMRMDLTVDRYETWDQLLAYMDGSAAVIGEMMLPVLEPISPAAIRPARALGLAFQLTNFLRDVGEDLERGRVYIPQDDLVRFGADPSTRRVDEAWRDLMRFEISRCRDLYDEADLGLPMLPGASGRCVRTARMLYSQILERIEDADYDVFTRRARVPTLRKVTTAARQLARR
jgi:phytoene synthase